jgi:hypothetical protein
VWGGGSTAYCRGGKSYQRAVGLVSEGNLRNVCGFESIGRKREMGRFDDSTVWIRSPNKIRDPHLTINSITNPSSEGVVFAPPVAMIFSSLGDRLTVASALTRR